MSEKKNAFLTVGIISAIILIFTVADILSSDRVFSDTENRILAAKPRFSWEELWKGDYTSDYEDYVTDQFVSRDKWITIKTDTDIALQKKEINGVYLGEDDYLIEEHDPEDYPAELEDARIAALKTLVERWDAQVMLVPTADNIISDKLPAYAPHYDQAAFLQKVKQEIGEENYIDVYSTLASHAEEEIYYRTDHHWTSLGAYYGFRSWAEHMNKFPYPYSVEGMETVTDDFQGTLHSKINLPVARDSIQIFPETNRLPLRVCYDYEGVTDTLYEPGYLETKNQYGYFLDDNHAFVEIETGIRNNKTLFVIKDSYANSMIPLLTTYYKKIYVMDLRYFNGKLFNFMEMNKPEKGMDVLVLYNCIHFLDEFMYY